MREEELEEFYKKAKKIATNKHYAGVDILSELGELSNEYNVTSVELRTLIDTKHPYWAGNFLEVIYDETVAIESELSVDDKYKFIKGKLSSLSPIMIDRIYDMIK